jgi:hypothetical protein
LLLRVGLAAALEAPQAEHVAMTIINGDVVHDGG